MWLTKRKFTTILYGGLRGGGGGGGGKEKKSYQLPSSWKLSFSRRPKISTDV